MTESMIMPVTTWEQRAADRSPRMQQSRARTIAQSRVILDAALRLIPDKGAAFTMEDLAREAGIALRTLYRYFASKDDVLIAVIGYAMSEACQDWAKVASELPDPLARLRFYIMSAIDTLDNDATHSPIVRFVVSERWRLHLLFPDDLAKAEKPFTELLLVEIKASAVAGQLDPMSAEWGAWFIAEEIRAVYHHFAHSSAGSPAEAKEQLWWFCLRALGGEIP